MSSNNHGRTSREQSLTFEDVPTPTHAERARTLVSRLTTGTLSTLSKADSAAGEGFPHGSYITFALHQGDPVFLISRIATHTQNLTADERASLLVDEDGADDPLANGRVTLLGRCTPLEDPEAARKAYLEVHPQAAYYADFTDFGFWKLRVSGIRYIGGYGRMSWVEPAAWSAAEADPLAAHHEGIVTHMNDDHADALVAYARAFTRATEAEEAVMTGIDRYGFEMSVLTDKGQRPARVGFAEQVATPTAARKALVAMVRQARERNE